MTYINIMTYILPQYPNPTHENPNPTEIYRFYFRLAGHWSRDHSKSSFSPVTPQGCIFTLRHGGWFGISVEKYVDSYLQISKILKYKDFRNFLANI